jgi:hypothetical protein
MPQVKEQRRRLARRSRHHFVVDHDGERQSKLRMPGLGCVRRRGEASRRHRGPDWKHAPALDCTQRRRSQGVRGHLAERARDRRKVYGRGGKNRITRRSNGCGAIENGVCRETVSRDLGPTKSVDQQMRWQRLAEAMKGQATEDWAPFFSLRRRLRRQILRRVSGPTTGAGGKPAGGASASTASGTGS